MLICALMNYKSQKEIAEYCGVHQPTVSKWMNDFSPISLKYVKKLLKLLSEISHQKVTFTDYVNGKVYLEDLDKKNELREDWF